MTCAQQQRSATDFHVVSSAITSIAFDTPSHMLSKLSLVLHLSIVFDTLFFMLPILFSGLHSALPLTVFLSYIVYLVCNTIHSIAPAMSKMQVPEGDYSFLLQRGGTRPEEEDRHPQGLGCAPSRAVSEPGRGAQQCPAG